MFTSVRTRRPCDALAGLHAHCQIVITTRNRRLFLKRVSLAMAKPARHGSTQRFVSSDVILSVNPTWLATEDLLEENTDSEIARQLLQESTELSIRSMGPGGVKQIKEQIKITEAIRMKIDIVDKKFHKCRRLVERTRRSNVDYEADVKELGKCGREISAVTTEVGLLQKYLQRLQKECSSQKMISEKLIKLDRNQRSLNNIQGVCNFYS